MSTVHQISVSFLFRPVVFGYGTTLDSIFKMLLHLDNIEDFSTNTRAVSASELHQLCRRLFMNNGFNLLMPTCHCSFEQSIDTKQFYQHYRRSITEDRITLWSPIHLSPLQNLRKQIGFAIAILYSRTRHSIVLFIATSFGTMLRD